MVTLSEEFEKNGKVIGLSEELREESLQVVLIDLRLLARRNAGWFEGELGLNVVGVALGELGSEGDPCLGWMTEVVPFKEGTIVSVPVDNNYW